MSLLRAKFPRDYAAISRPLNYTARFAATARAHVVQRESSRGREGARGWLGIINCRGARLTTAKISRGGHNGGLSATIILLCAGAYRYIRVRSPEAADAARVKDDCTRPACVYKGGMRARMRAAAERAVLTELFRAIRVNARVPSRTECEPKRARARITSCHEMLMIRGSQSGRLTPSGR